MLSQQNKSQFKETKKVEPNKQKRKKFYVPTTILIILGLMLLFIFVSWIGYWTHATTTVPVWNEAQQKYLEVQKPIIGMGVLDIFAAVWHGFEARAALIGFIFAVGSMLAIMTRTKAIDAGLERVVKKLNGKEIYMIPAFMFFFGLGGAVFGMWEETIAFFPLLMPIFIKAGYGPITTVFVVLLGAGAGNISSAINPFAVGIATSTANAATKGYYAGGTAISVGTMMGTRWLLFVLFELITITFVIWFARRVKSGKTKVHVMNEAKIALKFKSKLNVKFTWKRKLTLVLFALTFVIMILSYLPWSSWVDANSLAAFNHKWNQSAYWIATSVKTGAWEPWGEWYLISISALFLLMTIVVFALNNHDFIDRRHEKDPSHERINREQTFVETYMAGAKDVLPVCLIIAFAAGLGFILKQSHVGTWLATSVSGVGQLGYIGFGIVLFLLSLVLSMLMPSSSGFAAAFIPIFALISAKAFPEEPLMLGYVILIYILAEGIANISTPANAALVAYSEYCGISYVTYMKHCWKLLLIYFVTALLIIITVGGLLIHGVSF